MNDKLTNLWLAAHAEIALDEEPYVWLNGEFHEAYAVIETLKYVYNCFGLPNPLLPPSEEEIDAYIKSTYTDCTRKRA